jgi:hypothetical protein
MRSTITSKSLGAKSVGKKIIPKNISRLLYLLMIPSNLRLKDSRT